MGSSIGSFESFNQPDIPDSPGIYAFRAQILSPEQVGLIGNTNFDSDTLKNARTKLTARILTLDKLLSRRQYRGSIKELDKAHHLSHTLAADISELPTLNPSRIEARVHRIQDIVKLVRLLNAVTLALPPLYIGITIDQTLNARYRQHQSDYETNKLNCFGGRVLECGLTWGDLDYSALKLPTSLVDNECMVFAEHILHALGKPIFSNS
jgi:hypothetical protein